MSALRAYLNIMTLAAYMGDSNNREPPKKARNYRIRHMSGPPQNRTPIFRTPHVFLHEQGGSDDPSDQYTYHAQCIAPAEPGSKAESLADLHASSPAKLRWRTHTDTKQAPYGTPTMGTWRVLPTARSPNRSEVCQSHGSKPTEATTVQKSSADT